MQDEILNMSYIWHASDVQSNAAHLFSEKPSMRLFPKKKPSKKSNSFAVTRNVSHQEVKEKLYSMGLWKNEVEESLPS